MDDSKEGLVLILQEGLFNVRRQQSQYSQKVVT